LIILVNADGGAQIPNVLASATLAGGFAPDVFMASIEELIRAETGLTPINERSEHDFFFVGFPRSGHHWTQYLIAYFAFGLRPDLATDDLVQHAVPDIYDSKWYRRFREPMFFKSHELPQPDYRNVVYLVRDGRDAIVSYYHYQRTVGKKEPVYFNAFSPLFSANPVFWEDHVTAWLDNPYGARMLIVKYEDLLSDTFAQVRRMCDFFGLDRSDELLKTAVESCSFAQLQAKEKRREMVKKDWPEKSYFRRGQRGSFKDELPAAVLQEFERRAGSVLDRLGYPRAASTSA
jgi:hypothetical protein